MKVVKFNTLQDKWEDISDDYVIGDDGNVYKMQRIKSFWCRSKAYPYQQVRSTFGTDRTISIRIPRAVALAFVPRASEELTDVDHINNDKLDNRAENLQWLTHKENMRKMRSERRKK